jgi:hypothetical protein
MLLEKKIRGTASTAWRGQLRIQKFVLPSKNTFLQQLNTFSKFLS